MREQGWRRTSVAIPKVHWPRSSKLNAPGEQTGEITLRRVAKISDIYIRVSAGNMM
jgi:hypothetical protein